MRFPSWLTRQVFLLRGLKWFMVACTVWLTVDGLLWSRFRITITSAQEIASAAPGLVQAPVPLTLKDMEVVWARPLRQTLIDPKPKEPVADTAPPPPPSVPLPRLVATFVEKGKSWALFVDQKGSQRVRGEAQSIEDCEIVAISPGAVEIIRKGKPYQVRIVDKKSESDVRAQPRKKP